jgi:hypothetical protein
MPEGGIKMKLILALCGAALAAGCSSAPVRTSSVENIGVLRCDYAQMERIERAAKIERTELRWVNCPQLHDNPKTS